MSIHVVECYQVKCDHCGYIQEEYGAEDEFSGMCDPWRAQEDAYELHDWVGIDGRDLCPECYVLNDDEEPEEVKK